MLAIKKADKKEKLFWKRVIEDLNQETNDFKRAQEILIKNEALENTRKMAKNYTEKAKDILKCLPQNIYNNALLELCNFIHNRES